MSTPTRAACQREIEALHDFFVAYYTGRTDDIGRLEAALGPDFEMVTPEGSQLERDAVVELVAGKRDSFAPGAFDIDVRGVDLVDAGPGYAVARYEEHQETPAGTNARLSTVLFHADEGTLGGLSWVTVHETWLAEEE